MSTPVSTLNLKLYRGATFRERVVDALFADGAPVDLTGAQARAGFLDGTTKRLFTCTIASTTGNFSYVDPATQETVSYTGITYWHIELYLNATDTAAIVNDEDMPWELDVKYSNGDVDTLYKGTVSVEGQTILDTDDPWI